ncbi:T-kininogen 1-like [Discoglossus pictus]
MMKFLSTLLLCSNFLLCAANQALLLEADCDDQKIFDVVDLALRDYNAKKEYGNQFVLYRITEAKIKPEYDGATRYFVGYQVREGSCEVQSGKQWQECDFNPSTEGLITCSAQVFINKELNISNIDSQDCQPVQVEAPVTTQHFSCLGCYQPINTNSNEVLRLIEAAIEKMNALGSHPFLFNLDTIKTAERQVVHGWNYKIGYTVRQTNCSKSLFNNVSSEECALDTNGLSGSCNTRIFVSPYDAINDLSPDCKTDAGFCLDCPGVVDPNDPELVNLLRQVIDTYNADNNNTNLFNISKVESATKKGKEEKIFKVMLLLQETNCSKAEYGILGDECHFIEETVFSCEVNINVTNKEIDISTPVCHTVQTGGRRIAIVRGLSPFRTAGENMRLARHLQFEKQSKGHGPGNNHKDEKHGKKDKKEKKDKKDKKGKKKNKYDDSSEESEEVTVKPTMHEIPNTTLRASQITEAPTPTKQSQSPVPDLEEQIPPLGQTTDIPSLFPQIPAVPEEEENFLNIHGNVLEDLPEPTVTSAPKCPGKLWQPIRPMPIFPSFPDTNPFAIDLADALEDLPLPISDQDKDEKEVGSPSEPLPFNDADLLGF